MYKLMIVGSFTTRINYSTITEIFSQFTTILKQLLV